MSPEEERTVAAVTAKLVGEVYPGMQFNFGHFRWVVTHPDSGMWFARALENGRLLPAAFTEAEILQRLIP